MRDIGDVRLALEGAFETQPTVANRTSAIMWQAATAVFVLTTIAGFSVAYLARSAPPAVTRFFVSPPENTKFVSGPFGAASAAISPDGLRLAFTATDAAGKTPRANWILPQESECGTARTDVASNRGSKSAETMTTA
jgi:hypothetical protein